MEKKPILPIFFTAFMDLVGVGIIIPIFAVLFISPESGMLPASYDLATRSLLLGLLIAVYPFAQFFGAPLLGSLSDRHGRKPLIMISLVGTMISYLVFAVGVLTKNIPLLFVSRAVAGFAGGNIAILYSSVADISDPKTKAKDFGLIGVAFGLGFILGPFLGGKLADPSIVSWFTFATPFWFAAALALTNIIIVWLFFGETLKKKRAAPVSVFTGFQNVKKAFGRPHLRTLFTVMFFYMLGFMFFTQFFQVYLIAKFNLNQAQIGDTFAFMGLWMAITQGLITRYVAHKYKASSVANITLLLLAMTIPILLLPDTWFGIFFVLPFIALFQGLTMPNLAAVISSSAHADEQGEVLGINQSVQSLAMTAPPVISGFIFALHQSLPILIGSIMILVAWFVYYFFYKHSDKHLS
jgi:MFS transporter, DHA1 family, tetracycline resistance protein